MQSDHDAVRHTRFVLLVVGVAAVLLGGCRDPKPTETTTTFDMSEGDDIGNLVIRVSAPTSKTAEVFCGRENRGTGYLWTGAAMKSACVTAVISWPAEEFLEFGRLPSGRACTEAPEATKPAFGAKAEVTGTWLKKPISREIDVRSDCEAALWSYLSPLFDAAPQPVVFTEQDVSAP